MTQISSHPKRLLVLALLVSVVVLAGLALFLSQTQAAQAAGVPPVPQPQGGDETNQLCLGCHGQEGMQIELPNGEKLDIGINSEVFTTAVHGSNNLSCTQCHTNITSYPHPTLNAQTRKEYTLLYQQTCENCHKEQFQANQDSVHAKELAGGNLNAPTCSNCHDPHTQGKLTDDAGKLTPEAREWVALTCAQCHSATFEEYKKSVHGAGVLAENNPDVPTCTDCHGVHSIGDPTTAAFRLNSPQMCAECHTDASIMDKYGISTQVLETYIADFHGTTVTLFQKQHPDQEVNMPVCLDCHGVHDIRSADDPEKGLQVKENILVACQNCHPGATDNFPDSWLSHYIPSRDKYPLVYWVTMFYNILIPVVLGGMAVFVLSDVYRRFIRRGKPGTGSETHA